MQYRETSRLDRIGNVHLRKEMTELLTYCRHQPNELNAELSIDLPTEATF